MKIFEFRWTSQGEIEWVAAETVIQALKVYCSITDMDLNDFEADDDIVEIHQSEWPKYKIRDEEGSHESTFEQWMKENNRPDIIAGTMYE